MMFKSLGPFFSFIIFTSISIVTLNCVWADHQTLTIQELMLPEERKQTGIEKLNDQELQSLNLWLNKPTDTYCLRKQIVENPDELTWVYETKNLREPENKHYFLSVCAIIQNEADYLKEWIEYHKLLGVEHFWIYNHLSTDNYLEVLEPYIKRGEVDLIQWTVNKYPACQLTAYADGIQRASGRTHWLALIDVDEFFVPHKQDSLIGFLKDYESFGQVLVNWQIFGTSNLKSLSSNELITEKLIEKFPTTFDSTWNSNYFVKAIVKPDQVVLPVISSHYYNLKPEFITVDGSKHSVKPYTRTNQVNIQEIQLNHYWFRTLDYFYHVKMARREEVGDKYPQQLINWLLSKGRSEKDQSIQRFIPKLKNAMNEKGTVS